jgi:hypothetical protein
MKWKILSILLAISAVTACIRDKQSQSQNQKADEFFETVEQNHQSHSSSDTIKKTFQTFDVCALDSNHQKAFWFNAYSFFLDHYITGADGYLDKERFNKETFVIANDTFNFSALMEKINSYHDPRLMICVDFFTRTSTPSFEDFLTKNSDEDLNQLCTKYINNKNLIRVKKDMKQVFYPQHFDWQLKNCSPSTTSKQMILKYHRDSTQISSYRFKPYPFSYKIRSSTREM